MIVVKADFLKRAFDIIMREVESPSGEFNIHEDYYWAVPESAKYDFSKEPVELNAGQLSHDFERIVKICEGEESAIPYALVWLSALLTRIGEQVLASGSSLEE